MLKRRVLAEEVKIAGTSYCACSGSRASSSGAYSCCGPCTSRACDTGALICGRRSFKEVDRLIGISGRCGSTGSCGSCSWSCRRVCSCAGCSSCGWFWLSVFWDTLPNHISKDLQISMSLRKLKICSSKAVFPCPCEKCKNSPVHVALLQRGYEARNKIE